MDHLSHTFSCYVWSITDPTPRRYTWPAGTLVADAALEAALDFGFKTGIPHFCSAVSTTTLDRNKTLWGSGVRSGERLDLVVLTRVSSLMGPWRPSR